MPDHITILGGFGFLGSHLISGLHDAGYSITVFEHPKALPHIDQHLLDAVEIVWGDYQDAVAVLDVLRGAERVIHLIHTTVPGSSMRQPAEDIERNVVPALGWMRHLPDLNLKQLIYISTGGAIYGEPQSLPIKEDHPTDPLSSYGLTKLTIEKYLHMYTRGADLQLTILRPGNIYGTGQKLNTGQGVIGVMANRALKGEPIELWGDGSNIRDYLHVSDFVSAVHGLLTYDGPERVFNCGTGAGHTVRDVIAVLEDALNRTLTIRQMDPRRFDVSANILDSTRLHQATGWQARIDFEAGVRGVVEAMRAG